MLVTRIGDTDIGNRRTDGSALRAMIDTWEKQAREHYAKLPKGDLGPAGAHHPFFCMSRRRSRSTERRASSVRAIAKNR